MCGLAGIINVSPTAPPVAPDALGRMADALVHRGPDEVGSYVDPQGRCGLSFRRLSIIDLSTGHQPMSDNDGRLWLAFNGEIYNFRELRTELAALGHTFRTQSDSEVLLAAFTAWDTNCFQRLAGMFAVALWDERTGRLVLARDRFGKKPLYYAQLDGRVLFASELKAIVAAAPSRPTIDPQRLHEYLLFQYIPAPHAVYRGYHKLPPGHWLEVTAAGVGAPRAWWHLPQPPEFAGSYADARARLGELLTAAVERRLVADVPLGAFLSGGIDSSIVVGLMRRLGVSPLRTFSIGFPDARYDETAYARQVARHFGTEHHEHIVTPAAAEVLDTLAWHYDEPFADSSAIPTYYVSKWTRQHVTVALTGDAGDECFGGYDRYRAVALAARADIAPRPVRQGVARAAAWLPRGRAKSLGNRAYRFLSAVGRPPARRYLAWVNVFTPDLLDEGYRAEFRARIDPAAPLRWFEGLYGAQPPPAAERAIRTDFLSYLPYDLLTKVDIASMACSLECRAPLLDHTVVEFALSLPLEWRLGRRGGKQILRDWAADLLPPEVLSRGKMGFGVPVGEWFRGELRGLLRERVLAPDGLVAQLFDRAWLERFVTEHLSGHRNHEHPLWALLMLESWYRRWQPALG